MSVDLDADEWGDFAASEAPTPSSAQFTKGQAVEYKTSSGLWVSSRVISIDLSITPPSYCIELETGTRETEEWRLRLPGTQNEPLPPQQKEFGALSNLSSLPPTAAPSNENNISNNLGVDLSDDDFGDFTASFEAHIGVEEDIGPSKEARAGHGEGHHTPPKPSQNLPTSPHRHTPSKGSPTVLDSFHQFLRASAPEVAHRIEEEDSREEMRSVGASIPHVDVDVDDNHNSNGDDFGDFGDFEVAASTPTGVATDLCPSPAPAPPPVFGVLDLFGASPIKKAGKGVQEYGVAWSLLLEKAAEILETGRSLWSRTARTEEPSIEEPSIEETRTEEEGRKNSPTHQQHQHQVLLQDERVQGYLAALGRVYLVASLVRLAADQLGLMHVMPELHRAWVQCESSWKFSDTFCSNKDGDEEEEESKNNGQILSLEEAALRAADMLHVPLAQELAAVEAAIVSLGSLSMDEFPRMLVWCQGLDRLTLLPLSTFSCVPVVKWGDEREQRPCMAPLANFWMHCISTEEPELD